MQSKPMDLEGTTGAIKQRVGNSFCRIAEVGRGPSDPSCSQRGAFEGLPTFNQACDASFLLSMRFSRNTFLNKASSGKNNYSKSTY